MNRYTLLLLLFLATGCSFACAQSLYCGYTYNLGGTGNECPCTSSNFFVANKAGNQVALFPADCGGHCPGAYQTNGGCPPGPASVSQSYAARYELVRLAAPSLVFVASCGGGLFPYKLRLSALLTSNSQARLVTMDKSRHIGE
jgi:hypothetical protein